MTDDNYYQNLRYQWKIGTKTQETEGLEKEVTQLKKALRLACKTLTTSNYGNRDYRDNCPLHAELVDSVDFECPVDCTGDTGDRFWVDCWQRHFMEKAE